MKVLFVCSQGMSSEIVVKALKEEADKENIILNVKAVNTQDFPEEVQKEYNIAMVAPQIKHRFKLLKESADNAGVPCVLIEPMAYTPLGGPKLLKKVKENLDL